MAQFETILKNAQVVTDSGLRSCTIGVNHGKICGLLSPDEETTGGHIWDYEGKIILPGAIDTHGHIANKEELEYGTAMAARGGFSTVIEMPMSRIMPNNESAETFEERKRLIKQEAYVDIALWGAMYPDNLDRLDALWKKGCAGFKIFTCFAGTKYPWFDDYHMYKLFEAAAEAGAIIGIHGENQSICSGLTEEMIRQGMGAEGFEASRPVVAEVEAVSRVCLLAAFTGCNIHICHVTCPEAIEVINYAKSRGVKVTAETCIQYLTLTKDDIVRYGAYGKCGPPLRSEREKEGLWKAVLEGNVDMIGTDGTVYTEQEKEGEFWKAASGFPGMDIVIAALIDEGIHKRGLSWERMALLTAANAAEKFGLKEKGKIALGYDADFMVISPEKEWVFHAADTFWKVKTDKFPYEGRTYRGKVEATFVRGKAVYQEERMTGTKGYGRWIKPNRKETGDSQL